MLLHNCVYAGRGGVGAYVYACVKCLVCVGCYECVCLAPPAHCDKLVFMFYVFYPSKLERFMF